MSALTPVLDPDLFDLGEHLWIMHCAKGPAPRAAYEATRDFLEREIHPWALDLVNEWAGIPDGLRSEAAAILGARPTDITISASTSAALTTVAQGFPFAPGDEVLAPLGEFPSNAWPWKALEARGVTFREVPLWDGHRCGEGAMESTPPSDSTAPDLAPDAEDRIIAAIGPRTRLVAASWVRFQDGLRLDLNRIGQACRVRGVAFVVDGIQGVGTHVPSLDFVDAFACGGQKGCLGPQGHGFLWTAPDFRQRLVPQGSWLSVDGGSDLARAVTDFRRDWFADGRRLECGSLPLAGSLALRESLQTLNQVSVPAIEAHVERLQADLLARLAADPTWAEEAHRLEALRRSGRLGPLLCLHHQGRGSRFLSGCLKSAQPLQIHATAREGYLRIALHGWHGARDLDRLEAWLRT
ncbi:MAG TPA: aminotransferase class V-fold PLP-dependent enzyme [Holophaga sp.]|nr:aminotransferase class V-fold PLP-dependent enzyme [Holophaga sp.]